MIEKGGERIETQREIEKEKEREKSTQEGSEGLLV